MEDAARVLFVDDEPGSRESLTLLLEYEGYQVESVSDGENAIRLLSSNNYDVVITDLFLPGVCGIDILKACIEMLVH